jgi:prepilin-type N-terminal cleavage/methylation domain-containing protein
MCRLARRRRTGFSVFELLCALALVSVLLSIGLPRVTANLPRLLLEQAARRLCSEIELARLKAVSRNTRSRVVVELERASYGVEIEAEGRFDAEGPPRPLPDGIRFDGASSTRVDAGRVSITFLPRGHTSDNATIAIAAGGGDRRRVIVSSAGRVRIE